MTRSGCRMKTRRNYRRPFGAMRWDMILLPGAKAPGY